MAAELDTADYLYMALDRYKAEVLDLRLKVQQLEAALAEAQKWAKEQQAGKVAEQQKRRVCEVEELQAEVERLKQERSPQCAAELVASAPEMIAKADTNNASILRAHLQPPTASKPAAGGEDEAALRELLKARNGQLAAANQRADEAERKAARAWGLLFSVHCGHLDDKSKRDALYREIYEFFGPDQESGDEVPVQNQGAGEVSAAQGMGAKVHLSAAGLQEASEVPDPQPPPALPADDRERVPVVHGSKVRLVFDPTNVRKLEPLPHEPEPCCEHKDEIIAAQSAELDALRRDRDDLLAAWRPVRDAGYLGWCLDRLEERYDDFAERAKLRISNFIGELDAIAKESKANG